MKNGHYFQPRNLQTKKLRLNQVIIKPSENEVRQDYIQMLENSNNFWLNWNEMFEISVFWCVT